MHGCMYACMYVCMYVCMYRSDYSILGCPVVTRCGSALFLQYICCSTAAAFDLNEANKIETILGKDGSHAI